MYQLSKSFEFYRRYLKNILVSFPDTLYKISAIADMAAQSCIYKWNCGLQLWLSLTCCFSVTSENIIIIHIWWKLVSLGYIFVAKTTHLISTRCLKATALGEITQNKGHHAPFKVIQGHRIWCQSTANMRLPICD